MIDFTMELDKPTDITPPKLEPAPPAWMKRVPMITGGLAALAGFLTVRSANLSNDAIYRSNQGVLFQARASDTWGEYQADSIKARIVETAMLSSTAGTKQAADLQKQADDLRARQPKDKELAESFEKNRDEQLANGTKRLGEKDLTDYAGVSAQLGIALASVAALTRRRSAFTGGVLAGLAGVIITGIALLHHIR